MSEGKSNIRLIVVAGIVAIVLFAGVFVWQRVQARKHIKLTASEAAEQAEAAAAEVRGSEEPQATDIISVEEQLDEAVSIGALGNTSEASNDWAMERAEIEAKWAMAHGKVVNERFDMFGEVGSYHLQRERLKEEIAAKYGEITAERVDELAGTAEELEERFWAEGDFKNASSFAAIFEARALLEACLEVSPTNEAALREYVEVLWSGWPYSGAGSGRSVAEEWEFRYQHKYDLVQALITLWDERLSKKETLSNADLALAFDLTRALHWQKVAADSALDEEFRRLNPNPSAQILELHRNGFTVEKIMEIAKRAREIALSTGEETEEAALFFGDVIEMVNSGARLGSPSGEPWRHVQEDITIYPDFYTQAWVGWGRGKGWIGPAKRKPYLLGRKQYDEIYDAQVKSGER